MERTVDLVAARVGLDPAEVRQRNLVPPQDFPYTTPTRLVYDSASFTASFQRLLDMAEYPRLRQEQARARQQGRYLGIGLACYIELGAIGSASALAPGLLLRSGNDRATVRIEPSGTVTVLLGSASHGQSHETTFAQLVADTLGVDMHAIRVWHGNTAISPYGLGTFASRSAVMMGGAVLRSAQAVRQKVQRIAARLLEARPDDLVMQQGTVQVNGSPQRAMSLAEVAHVAYFQAQRLPPGEEPGLEACLSYDPVRGTVANGAHLAVVDVDIETGAVRILRYLVVEDCGTMLNPMVVEGQVHGGVSHGIGNALLAEMHYDEAGQLQTATLMDYLVPAATEVPDMHIDHLETPSPVTLGGMKGMGEGGTVGAVAAVVGAVADAVAPLGAVLTRIPLTPERLVEEIQKAGCIIVHQQNSARNA
jgi:carbon-monoxide dehydrogenase large subunit